MILLEKTCKLQLRKRRKNTIHNYFLPVTNWVPGLVLFLQQLRTSTVLGQHRQCTFLDLLIALVETLVGERQSYDKRQKQKLLTLNNKISEQQNDTFWSPFPANSQISHTYFWPNEQKDVDSKHINTLQVIKARLPFCKSINQELFLQSTAKKCLILDTKTSNRSLKQQCFLFGSFSKHSRFNDFLKRHLWPEGH